VENPAAFIHFERANIPADLAIYGGGRASSGLLEWLAKNNDAAFHLIHLPDYDPVGLSEFIRLRGRLGSRVSLHLPKDLRKYFERYSNPALLQPPRSRVLLGKLRASANPEVREVLHLIEEFNAGLEQECLFLGAESGITSPSL
jgi:hypothetical protein